MDRRGFLALVVPLVAAPRMLLAPELPAYTSGRFVARGTVLVHGRETIIPLSRYGTVIGYVQPPPLLRVLPSSNGVDAQAAPAAASLPKPAKSVDPLTHKT